MIDLDTVSYDNVSVSNTINKTVSKEIADVLELDTQNSNEYSLIFGAELAEFGIVLQSNDSEDTLSNNFDSLHEMSSEDLSQSSVNVVEIIDESEKTAREEEAKRKAEEERLRKIQSSALMEIDNPDARYTGKAVSLSDSDRELLEHLVMGEAGGEGMIGASLVAQAIRDTMVYKGFSSVAEVRNSLKYSGSINNTPNETVKKAINFIFDQGGCAVKHKIFYFYAPKYCNSSWHEAQTFVVEYKGHRFFSSNK